MSVKFREAMPVGSKWKIEYSQPDTIIRGNAGPSVMGAVGGVRTVREHRSKDMKLEISESGRPDRDGVISTLTYPKSHFWKKNDDGSVDVMHSAGALVGTRLMRYTPYEG